MCWVHPSLDFILARRAGRWGLKIPGLRSGSGGLRPRGLYSSTCFFAALSENLCTSLGIGSVCLQDERAPQLIARAHQLAILPAQPSDDVRETLWADHNDGHDKDDQDFCEPQVQHAFSLLQSCDVRESRT